MDSVVLGPWTIQYDAETTRAAYTMIAANNATICSCAGCRNFRLAQEQGTVLSPELLALLRRFGIAPDFPAEVYDQQPSADGVRYGGWFHFVGVIVANDLAMEAGPSDGSPRLRYDGAALVWPGTGKNCRIWLTSARALLDSAFADLPTVQLEFEVDVPWLLAESYAP